MVRCHDHASLWQRTNTQGCEPDGMYMRPFKRAGLLKTFMRRLFGDAGASAGTLTDPIIIEALPFTSAAFNVSPRVVWGNGNAHWTQQRQHRQAGSADLHADWPP